MVISPIEGLKPLPFQMKEGFFAVKMVISPIEGLKLAINITHYVSIHESKW